MYKNALKEDFIRVVEDLDGTVESTDTIAKLKTKIEKSSTFESDPDFVKTLIKNCIDERVSRNEREVTLEKQKIELAKLQLAKLEKEVELQTAKNKAISLNPAAKVEEKQFETLNKETATHIGIREAEDWFRPIDLAKECDIYISSRSGSHKEIPITYGYTQDPFKNRSQNFKPKIKENYPQYLERENKNCFICGDSSHYARDCEKRFKPKESNDHIHNRINVNTLKVESEKQNSDEFANLQYVSIFVENQPVTALIDSGCQIPVLNSSLIRVQTPSEEIITLSSCFGEQRMVEVKPINLSLNQHSPGLSVRTAISPTLTEEIIIHPSVYSEIKKLGHAKSDVLLSESGSSLGVHFNSNVSFSNVIENSSCDWSHVKNFNTRNDLSSLIKDYKCNKIKSTKLKLSIIREKCSDIVLYSPLVSMKKEKRRTAYSQAGRCGMQPKPSSLRAQAQLSETKTELMRTETVETFELVKVEPKLLREEKGERERAHREYLKLNDSRHSGNFIDFFKLLSKYDLTLREHMQRINEKQLTQHYLSHDIQNELIALMSKSVIEEIIHRAKQEKYCAFLLDCTRDVSRVEQMSIILRFFNSSTGAIEEHFVGFIAFAETTGEYITNSILQELERNGLDIQNCRGQEYDNGANMVGINKGVRTRILNINPTAFFTPCRCHSWNLLLIDAANSSATATTFFGYINKIYVLFSKPSKRWYIVKTKLKLTLKPLSETRWENRIRAVKAIFLQFDDISKLAISSSQLESRY
ncbi:zinc finger MYM-type protein 1 [Trichonephila clavipes]|nr:zinc finger MYM-type protein 1 [Trichonephila clavipes]